MFKKLYMIMSKLFFVRELQYRSPSLKLMCSTLLRLVYFAKGLYCHYCIGGNCAHLYVDHNRHANAEWRSSED